MSGIFGYLSGPRFTTALPIAQRMSATMNHHDYFAIDHATPQPDVALGRINIGIFNTEPQPVRSADGQVWLYLCGEFYHQEQRRASLAAAGALDPAANDANFALQIYLRGGAVGLAQLEGAFTLAVWDNRSQELLLLNDHFGLYPHYFAHMGGAFIFAPEIKALLSTPNFPRRLNLTAVAEYVRFQQLLGDKTWFEDVQMLPPASVLRYRPAVNQLTLTRYWDWDAISVQPQICFDEAVEECIRLFQRAIDAMTAPPHRVGVYLSGGLDGRTILGFIDRQTPVTTITFGVPGCRDVLYATKLAQRAGSNHHWFPLTNGRWVQDYAPLHLALTEGMHSWMHAHGISTLADARTLMDVNLSGWDGGTVLGGRIDEYESDDLYRHPPSETDLTMRLYDAFCRYFAWPGLTEAEAKLLFSGNGDIRLRGRAFESLQAELAHTAHYPADRRAEYFYILHHDRRSTQNMVVFTRSAIEVRCPFFDYDLISFIYSLPEHIRTTPALHRAVITQRMPHLATVPYDKDNRLPHSNPVVYWSHDVLQRAQGWVNTRVAPVFPRRPRLYADYETYLRTDLRAWAENLLFDQRTQERGLFDQTVVRALWERHLSGAELWTIGKIAPLITMEMTLRQLYDEISVDERAYV